MCGAYVHCLGAKGGGWRRGDRERHASPVERESQRGGVQPLLGALVRADEVETALEVFDEMQTEDGVLPRRSRSCSWFERARSAAW